MATTTSERNAALLRRSFEALNDRDREGFERLHPDDVVIYHNDEAIEGLEAVVEDHWSNFEAFPDMEFALEETIADDDGVACRFVLTGTHESEYEGIPPTGERVELPASGTFRIEDDGIAKGWIHYDRLGLLDQLGVVDSPIG